MHNSFDRTLDTLGLNCPEPVMMLHKEIRAASSGEIIRMIASDPSTVRDVPKFCQFLGHELLGSGRDEHYYYFIRKV